METPFKAKLSVGFFRRDPELSEALNYDLIKPYMGNPFG